MRPTSLHAAIRAAARVPRGASLLLAAIRAGARVPRGASLLLAAIVAAASPASAAVLLPPGFADHVVTAGFDRPTAFAFLPDGRVLVAEQKTGAIRLVIGGSVSPQPLVIVPNLVTAAEERGLLAIAVDPAWPARPFVYVHATVQGDVMRLLRYTATGTLTGPTSFGLALGDPYLVLDGLADVNPVHNGGALRFAPDGRLFYSLGDDFDACQARDSTTLHGALLRLDVSKLPAGPGGPPPRAALVCPDNPWAGGADPDAKLVWAYGLRNPFRFVVDPQSGTPYVSDVGDNSWEELDEVTAGFDGGWPFREGPALHTWLGCNEPGGQGHGSYDGPIDSYDHNEGFVIIAAGVVRYRFGSAWPVAWDGNVLYADYYTGFLRMVGRVGGSWQRIAVAGQPDPPHFATGLTSPVDFAWGPNGDLYWLQQDDGAGTPNKGVLHRIHAADPAAVSTVPGGARLALAVSPNPAAGAVSLRLTLALDGPVRLTVSDVSGRVVATPLDGALSRGTHTLSWNGRDASGRETPGGLYFARLITPAGVVTTRIARVR